VKPKACKAYTYFGFVSQNLNRTKMKKLIPSLFVIFLIMFMYSSCYYDNEEYLYPNNTQPCDTSNVTYSQSIAPITTANCNVCHSTALHSGSVVTDNYDGLKKIAQENNNTRLLNAVEWTGPIHMPKDGNKLPGCDLAKISIWVHAGAPNN
jgi:hypothetical protein